MITLKIVKVKELDVCGSLVLSNLVTFTEVPFAVRCAFQKSPLLEVRKQVFQAQLPLTTWNGNSQLHHRKAGSLVCISSGPVQLECKLTAFVYDRFMLFMLLLNNQLYHRKL